MRGGGTGKAWGGSVTAETPEGHHVGAAREECGMARAQKSPQRRAMGEKLVEDRDSFTEMQF